MPRRIADSIPRSGRCGGGAIAGEFDGELRPHPANATSSKIPPNSIPGVNGCIIDCVRELRTKLADNGSGGTDGPHVDEGLDCSGKKLIDLVAVRSASNSSS
jgi:hypothetical protein